MKKSLATLFALSLISVGYAETEDSFVTKNGATFDTYTYITEGSTLKTTFTGDGENIKFDIDANKEKDTSIGHISAIPKDYTSTIDGKEYTRVAEDVELIIGTEGKEDATGEAKTTKVKRAASVIRGYVAKGNKTVTVYADAKVGTLVGGYDNDNKYGFADGDPDSKSPNQQAGSGKAYFAKTDPTKTIKINVLGGEVNQIYGSFVGNSPIYNEVTAAKAKLSGDALAAYLDNPAWATNEKVQITVDGGKVGIICGGGFNAVVNNEIGIEVIGASTITRDVYGGSASNDSNYKANARVGSTFITIADGSVVEGSVYGGGLKNGANRGETEVRGDTTITIKDSIVKTNVYGAGNGGHVTGNTTINLQGTTEIMGVVSGGGTNGATVGGTTTLTIGDGNTPTLCTIGSIENFDVVNVKAGARLTQTGGNIFAVRDQTYTLSSANLTKAAVSGARADVLGSARATAEEPLTLTLLSNGPLANGKYMVAQSEEAPTGWSDENVDVEGIAGYDDLLWENNVLYFVYSAVEPQALIAANWGVFKSSQAFTGTLWGNRSNVIEIPQGRTVTDEKGISTTIAPTGKTLAWATVYGQGGRISGVGADYNLYGGAVGVEHQFANGSSVGAAMGYDWGKVSPFTQSAVDQETLHAALYGRAWAKQLDAKSAVALDWSVAYGQTESSHDDVAEDWSQDSWQFDVRATYSRALTERLTASGFVGVQYYTHDSDTADGLDISSMHNLRVSVGAGLNYAATEKTNVYGELSVYRDAMRHNPYVAIDGTRFYGTNPGRTGVNVGVGAQHALSDDWALRAGYNFQAAEDSTEHNVNVGAVYTF